MPKNSKVINLLEQEEQILAANVPQKDQLSDCSRSVSSTLSSSSSSSSIRVDMTGETIPTGPLCRQVSDPIDSERDDDESDLLEEEYLANYFSHEKGDTKNIAPSPNCPRQKKRVSFDSIDIREYSRCLQMHPETVRGPPIGLDWEYEKVGTFNFEEFQTNREYNAHIRRRRWSFLIPANVREALLIDSGHTEEEMKAVVEEVKEYRQQRRQSFEAQEYEDWTIMKEACKRRFRRWKTGVSKKREQELLWEAAAMRVNKARKMCPASKAA